MVSTKKTTATAAETIKKEAVKPVEVKAAVKAADKPVEVKAAAKPVAEKAVKKTTAKTTAKKAPAKKTDVKVNVNVQFSGKSYTTEELVKIAKDVWKYDLKQKVSDFKSVDLYIKPEENLAYYVINDEVAGSFLI